MPTSAILTRLCGRQLDKHQEESATYAATIQWEETVNYANRSTIIILKETSVTHMFVRVSSRKSIYLSSKSVTNRCPQYKLALQNVTARLRDL